MNNEIGVYVHIPFCLRKCYYCDFASYENMEKLIEPYINALCDEILKNSEILSQYKITTIYIGGGTPSCLTHEELKELFKVLNKFHRSPKIEFTIECNLNDIEEEKFTFLYEQGVNRLSIGIESFDEEKLEFMKRTSNFKDAKKKISLLRKIGFKI